MASSLNEIFDNYDPTPQDFRMDLPAYPTNTIRVILRLKNLNNLESLIRNLRNFDLDLTRSDQHRIIVSGSLPDSKDFDENNVLNIVQRHDPDAVLDQ